MEDRAALLSLIGLIIIVRTISVEVHPHQRPGMLRRAFMGVLVAAVDVDAVAGLDEMPFPPVGQIAFAPAHRQEEIGAQVLAGADMGFHGSQGADLLDVKVTGSCVSGGGRQHPVRYRFCHPVPFRRKGACIFPLSARFFLLYCKRRLIAIYSHLSAI